MINRRNLRISNAKRQKGMTLIELALVIAVGAALLFGIFIVLNNVQNKRVTNKEASNLTMMASDLRTKFSNQGTFLGLSNANAIRLNLVPKPMISGANIVTGFGTNVTIAAANVNGTANDGFQFTYDVPSDNCSDFVANAEAGFSRITIGGTVVKDLSTGDNALSVADQAACNATATGNANTTVVFAQGK